jgi:hypothetical protein
MLYQLFMFWVVVSITGLVASMVLGGILCVWCALIGRKRAELSSTSCVSQGSHEVTSS